MGARPSILWQRRRSAASPRWGRNSLAAASSRARGTPAVRCAIRGGHHITSHHGCTGARIDPIRQTAADTDEIKAKRTRGDRASPAAYRRCLHCVRCQGLGPRRLPSLIQHGLWSQITASSFCFLASFSHAHIRSPLLQPKLFFLLFFYPCNRGQIFAHE